MNAVPEYFKNIVQTTAQYYKSIYHEIIKVVIMDIALSCFILLMKIDFLVFMKQSVARESWNIQFKTWFKSTKINHKQKCINIW